MAIHIVLVEPEIPPNTGNIARSCAATGAPLHLVKPLGFSIDDRSLKRAGLDYWPFVKLEVHESLEEFLYSYEGRRMYLATTKGVHRHTDVRFQDEDMILFGRENEGPSKRFHRETSGKHPEDPHECGYTASFSESGELCKYRAFRSVAPTGFSGSGIRNCRQSEAADFIKAFVGKNSWI